MLSEKRGLCDSHLDLKPELPDLDFFVDKKPHPNSNSTPGSMPSVPAPSHSFASTSSTSPSSSRYPSSSSSLPVEATPHIRSLMSNVLGEFSALISENSLDIPSFKERWYEPCIAQILDALRDQVLLNDEKTRRDATLWLRFLRKSMRELEKEEMERQDEETEEGDEGGEGGKKGKGRISSLSGDSWGTEGLRSSISEKSRRAYFDVCQIPLCSPSLLPLV